MWKKCVILEHCVHVSAVRLQSCHIFPIQKNLPGIRLFQPRDNAQCSGFTTAGRSQQCDKFAFFCRKADAIQDVLPFLEALFYVFEF